MKRSFIAMVAAAAVTAMLAMGLLAGCMGTAPAVNTEQQANRAYMSQVNQIMDEVTVQLDAFVEAVSSGDVVAMRTQADNASQALAQMSALEAPEALKDIQQSYVDGTGKLQDALDQYVALYAETESGSFDSTTFNERLGKIQDLYNEGVAALQKGDEDAAAL